MPTYDYECDACKHSFEQFQPITAKPIRKCPQCGKTKVRRLIGTGAGIIFKGSGFYQTDYRSASYRQAAEKDKAPSAAPAASSSTAGGNGSSDAKGATEKPAAKTEPKSEPKSEPKAEPKKTKAEHKSAAKARR